LSVTGGRSSVLTGTTTRILVCSPQIIENYQLQSGEGLSVLFIVIWLFADVTGLVGAIIAGLLPTLIIVAAYVSAIRFLRYLFWRFWRCATKVFGFQISLGSWGPLNYARLTADALMT
jgi:hypothetical protein